MLLLVSSFIAPFSICNSLCLPLAADDRSLFFGSFIDQFAFNQHEFLKGGTQKETEDKMLETLKESISLPGRVIW